MLPRPFIRRWATLSPTLICPGFWKRPINSCYPYHAGGKSMERVTGIGGVSFKARDPEKLAAWYAEHLGVVLEGGSYAVFHWRGGADGPAGRPNASAALPRR